MKLGKFTLILTAVLGANIYSSLGQGVGINTTGAAANSKSMLDVDATGKGMLIPRMTWASRPTGLSSTEAGMLIYSTDGDGTNGPGFYYYTGTAWTTISSASTSGAFVENQSATAQVARFRLNGDGVFDGGNIGVGTTTPTAKIEIQHNLGPGGGSTNNNEKAFYAVHNRTFNTTSGALTDYVAYLNNTSSRASGGNNLNNVALYATASNGQNNYAAIFDQGNVGIGTTAPGEKFHVVGNAKFSGLASTVATTSITNASLVMASSTGDLRSTLGSANQVLKVNSAGTAIEWGSAAVTSLSIPAATGDILYYNGTSWVNLTVPGVSAGSAGIQYALTLPNAGTGTPSWVATNAFSVAGDGMGNCIATANINLNSYNLVGTGNISISGKVVSNGINETSDARFKKNIRPLTNSLDRVLAVNGVTYNWRKEEFPEKAFKDKTEIGFIAQELELYFPELVETDSQGYKSVQYSHMVPVLLEAIKEQQKLINQLQGTVSNLSQAVYGKDITNPTESGSAEVIRK